MIRSQSNVAAFVALFVIPADGINPRLRGRFVEPDAREQPPCGLDAQEGWGYRPLWQTFDSENTTTELKAFTAGMAGIARAAVETVLPEGVPLKTLPASRSRGWRLSSSAYNVVVMCVSCENARFLSLEGAGLSCSGIRLLPFACA